MYVIHRVGMTYEAMHIVLICGEAISTSIEAMSVIAYVSSLLLSSNFLRFLQDSRVRFVKLWY